MVTPPLLKVRIPLPPEPSAPLPPVAVTVPPEMVRLPLWMPSPLSLPPLLLPPVALTVPPEMVTPPLLKMPLPLPPWAVRLLFSPPEMVRLPLLEMPLPPLPPVRELSPFRVSVTSPFEVRAEPESALMFTLSSVTSTLSFLSLVSMVTVWEEAVSLSLFVMMVSVSFLVVTLFWVTSLPVSPAFTVMSPFSMDHVPAKAGAARVVSITAVRINAAAR